MERKKLYVLCACVLPVMICSGLVYSVFSLYIGVYQQTISVGWMIGPAFGGFLSDVIGFRTIFLLGAVLAAAGFILVLFLVEEPRRQSD
jgi:predicted MFS family arabinose efflux permease